MKKLLQRSWIAFFWLGNQLSALREKPWARRSFLGFIVAGLLVAFPILAQEAEKQADKGIAVKLMEILASLAEQVAKAITAIFQLFLDGLIVVMGVENLTTNPFVEMGWSVVRDSINLFYVIILIVIAMGVIFGQTSSKFKWQQSIPRLLIFALVINFSKTLCSLMLDFSQVIMLTFVNALKDFQGGNMLTMMGIMDVYKLDFNSASGAVQKTTDAASMLVNILVAIMVLAGVTVTVGILFAVMVYRIVLIWILVVLAPLAWFVGGAKELLGSNAYAEWWSKWKCALIIGPLLSFFLWLTLAVAGSGSLAVDSGFMTPAGARGNNTGLLSEIFNSGKFISMILSLGILFAGLEAAASVCSGEGMIKGLVGTAQKWTKKASTGALIGAAGLAYLKTREGAQAVKGIAGTGVKGLGMLGSAAAGATAGALTRQGGAVGAAGKALNLTRRAGRAEAGAAVAGYLAGKGYGRLAGAASSYARSAQESVAKDYKGAAGSLAEASTDDQVAYLSAMSDKGGPGVMDKRKTMDLLANVLTDPRKREAFQKTGKLEKLYRAVGKDMENAFKGDKDISDRLRSFSSSRPDLTNKVDEIDSIEDVQKLDRFALMDPNVQARLGQLAAPSGSNAASMADYIGQGRMGDAKRRALTEGRGALYQGMRPDELNRADIEDVAPHVTVDMVNRSPQLADRLLSSTDPTVTNVINSPNNIAVYNQILQSRAGIDVAGGRLSDPDRFRDFITRNPKALGNLAPNVMQMADVRRAAAEALGNSELKKALAELKRNPSNTALENNLRVIAAQIRMNTPTGTLPKRADYITDQIDSIRRANP